MNLDNTFGREQLLNFEQCYFCAPNSDQLMSVLFMLIEEQIMEFTFSKFVLFWIQSRKHHKCVSKYNQFNASD